VTALSHGICSQRKEQRRGEKAEGAVKVISLIVMVIVNHATALLHRRKVMQIDSQTLPPLTSPTSLLIRRQQQTDRHQLNAVEEGANGWSYGGKRWKAIEM
jgi:hypothetical protein